MERYLNDAQRDHMRELAKAPERVCPCGWYWKDECEGYCPHPEIKRAGSSEAYFASIRASRTAPAAGEGEG